MRALRLRLGLRALKRLDFVVRASGCLVVKIQRLYTVGEVVCCSELGNGLQMVGIVVSRSEVITVWR